MTKEEFYKKNDSKFLSLGFRKVTGDPYFAYGLAHPYIDDAELTMTTARVFYFFMNDVNIRLKPMSPEKAVKWFYSLLVEDTFEEDNNI